MRLLISSLMTVSLLQFFVYANHAAADSKRDDLPRFMKLNDGVYRGGLPSERGMQILKAKGIQTILNIETNVRRIEQEKIWAQKYGIDFISIPMKWNESPTDEMIDEIMSHLQNEKMAPIYLHCLHGEDRTGLVMGLYRVWVDGWSAQEAYDEMLEMNFHPHFKALDDYFWHRAR